MPIKPSRVTTCGRGSNWGFRVLGPQSEVLATRWRFPTEQAARQAGIAASMAISSTSITMSQGPARINRNLQKPASPKQSGGSWGFGS